MKKKGLLLLFVLLLFIGVSNISAATLHIESGNSTYVEDDESNKVYNKTLDGTVTYCVSGFGSNPQNGTCSLKNNLNNMTASNRAVIGQIISDNCPNGCSFGSNYAITEIAIFEYLQHKGYNIKSTGNTGIQSTAIQMYQTAETNVQNHVEPTISLSNNGLKFEYINGYYQSNTIAVSNSNELIDINFDVSGIDSQYLYEPTTVSAFIKIPADKISKNTNITLSVSAAKSYPTVDLYDCESGQDVAVLTSYNKSSTKTVTGEIIATGKLTINKVDGNNKPLSGAKIKVTGTKGYNKEFETKGQPIVIENLEYDTYTIEEIEAPTGYIKAVKQTVNLSNTNLTANITLTDKIVKTIFSKVDATGKKELPGAFLEIQDLEGKVVKLCPGSDEEEYSECTWISTNEPYVVEGLPVGKYYLVETIAPEGYVLSKEKVLFQITGNEETVKVEMKNQLNKVKISKISAVNKKELPGATLEIQDKYGKVVEYCTNDKGKKNQPCIWVSTDKPYEIEGLPNGKYYLVETLAPEGYVLNKEKVEFIVDGEQAVVEVEMKNELEVKVPDTLSARSTLLIAISMFDIALGIGILTYVKKNKFE